MSEQRLSNKEFVARAIFLPAMLDSNGNVSLAAFKLRHNEGYFSVARMAVGGWMEDIRRIPTSPTRQLGGYCKMGGGGIRALGFAFNKTDNVAFNVEDRATDTNKSHAGIILTFSEKVLKGDKAEVLKPLPTGVSATGLLLRVQTKLSQLAAKNYVTIGHVFGGGDEGVVEGSTEVNIQETPTTTP